MSFIYGAQTPIKKKRAKISPNWRFLYFLCSIVAVCKASPLPSPVTRATNIATLTAKCVRMQLLAPTSRATRPSLVICLPLPLRAVSSDSSSHHPSTVLQTPLPTLTRREPPPSPTASQETNVQSAPSIYHHLSRGCEDGMCPGVEAHPNALGPHRRKSAPPGANTLSPPETAEEVARV